MELQPKDEHVLPGEQYWNLFQQITEAQPDTLLNVDLLDKLLRYGSLHYKHEAHKSDELHEDFGMAYRSHYLAEQGSYYEEKLQFCKSFAEMHKDQALTHERLGNNTQAQWYRIAASNWYRLAAACLLIPEARP